jgi:hypothetical protein
LPLATVSLLRGDETRATCFGTFWGAEEDAVLSSSARSTPEATTPNGREDVSSTPAATVCHGSDPGSPMSVDPPPLRGVHTSNFSAILQVLGISAPVTTYQAGALMMLRALLVVA